MRKLAHCQMRVVAFALAIPCILDAQSAARRLATIPLDDIAAAAVAQSRHTGHVSFALEALGGSVGSAIGIGIVALSDRCGVEDLACTIQSVALAGVAGLAGAALGSTAVARAAHAPRSALGAVLGGIVGTGVALGVHAAINRGTDRNLGDRIVAPLFVLGQGIFAAWGSRIGSR